MGGGRGRLGRVGPYTLVERLGRGGMGEVYLATTRRGENVALKMLHDAIEADSEARIRLEREVRALRRVESPYVARVLDADLICDRPYLVMEHIEGDTLLDRVRQAGPLDGADLIVLAQGLAAALAIIHAAGVVHRDLKPANVLIGPSSEPVLIDFGIAQVLDATRLTMTGTFLGTPGYAAPELFADEPVGAPADVHAWAATVAFAATGRPTFGRGTVEAQMYAILNGQADLAGVPAALLPLLRAALHREAAKRPTAALLSARLTRLARATSPEPRKPAAPARVPGSARKAAPAEPPSPPKPAKPAAEKTGERAGTRKAGTKTESGGAEPGPEREPSRGTRLVAEGREPRRVSAAGPRISRSASRGRQADSALAAEAAPAGSAGPLPAGNVALVVLALLAVPCVVASVIWPVATFAVTGFFAVLARTVWVGHWLVRKRRSAPVRGALRVLGFPLTFAGSLASAAVWPGLPAAGLAAFALWLALGGALPLDWWQRPAPVAVAGVVFGVVCGGIIGREVERVGSGLPELRREGLRALAVLGGFVALCAAAVRVVALVL
ncbi:serine/threonine protein kinase [Planomonospora sp. ID67723]|uniref:protein kinase domain-containing protein n=1 Tax=Planomonospora sp. ID67723 TaxID=2738134 RepID=UPI0018C44A6B|nr:serine/threonine-protein kinase [Planomonospora sp. ID67723]MBG0830399.1 serine/threonine protein kinase [Planomonospora sp. ID67723]